MAEDSAKYKSIARKTGYKAGKSLKNSVVTRHLMCAPFPIDSEILDFGAGFKATQSQILSVKYPKIKAYDFPETIEDSINDVPELKKFFTDSPKGDYDLVLASNVVNVQRDLSALQNTLNEIYCTMNTGATLIVNIPKDPIKFVSNGKSTKYGTFKQIVQQELEHRFGEEYIQKIEKVCGKKSKTTLLQIEKKNNDKEKIFCPY